LIGRQVVVHFNHPDQGETLTGIVSSEWTIGIQLRQPRLGGYREMEEVVIPWTSIRFLQFLPPNDGSGGDKRMKG
jgi:hypothetical protein